MLILGNNLEVIHSNSHSQYCIPTIFSAAENKCIMGCAYITYAFFWEMEFNFSYLHFCK